MNRQFLCLLPLVSVLASAPGILASPRQLSSAAKGINAAQAPVPTLLLDGKKVFVSFDLGDVLDFPYTYSGGPERAYSEFYEDMKQWGHYVLVLDPQDADLIFSVRFVGGGGYSGWPRVRLVVSDEKTHVELWGFVEQIDGALFKKHRDKAFSDAVMWLVDDVQALVAPTSPVPFPLAEETRVRYDPKWGRR